LPVNFCLSSKDLPIEYCGLIVLQAYPERIAKQRNNHGHYLTAYGKGVLMNEADALAGESYIVAAQLFQRQQTLNIALAAEFNLAQAIAWDVIKTTSKTHLQFDNQLNRVICAQQQVIGALVIKDENTTKQISPELLMACWCQQIRKKGLDWLKLDADTQQLLLRWRWVNSTQRHLDFPEVDEKSLLVSLEQWLGPYLTDITTKNQLDKLNFSELLLSQLDYQQQQAFKKIAPTFFVGPTARKCAIRYSLKQAPIVSLPMQELYGVTVTPVVGDKANNSDVALIIEILSPAKRPIQVTQDLVAFWQGSYRAVQKDMKSQYPRHFWPDDPANAQATRKTKRHLNI
jgi:ATP-dependent helicase HrpB